MKKEKKPLPFRLTITRPHGDTAFDQIITPGQNASVAIHEDINYDAARLFLAEKKDVTITRVFKIRIRRLE